MRNRADVEAHIRNTPIEGTPDERRRAFEVLAGNGPEGTPTKIGGVPCRTFGTGPTVLWLHGGGYMFGSSTSHSACASALASEVKGRVVVPDYRLAPENPWPAQLDDAIAVFTALDPKTPVVGDSAGGHLALVLAAQTRADPSCLALISPNTDRTGLNSTRQAHSSLDLMNDHTDDMDLARTAVGAAEFARPDISPVLGDLSSVPPVYLSASESEVLAGDAAVLQTALRQSGRSVHMEWLRDMFHMWTLWPQVLPEARDTIAAIARHIEKHRP